MKKKNDPKRVLSGPKPNVKEYYDSEGNLIHTEVNITHAHWHMWASWKLFKYSRMKDIDISFGDVMKQVDLVVMKKITNSPLKRVVEVCKEYLAWGSYESKSKLQLDYVMFCLEVSQKRLKRHEDQCRGEWPLEITKWEYNGTKKNGKKQWNKKRIPTVWGNNFKPLKKVSLNLERTPRTGAVEEWTGEETGQFPKTAGEELNPDWSNWRKLNIPESGPCENQWTATLDKRHESLYDREGNEMSAIPARFLRTDLDYWERSDHLAEQNVGQLTTRQEWNAWIGGCEVDLFEKVQEAIKMKVPLSVVMTEYEKYCYENELFNREGRVEVPLQDIDHPQQHDNAYSVTVRSASRSYSTSELKEAEDAIWEEGISNDTILEDCPF